MAAVSEMLLDALFLVPTTKRTTQAEVLTDVKNIIGQRRRPGIQAIVFEGDETVSAGNQKNSVQRMIQAAYEDPLWSVRLSVRCCNHRFESKNEFMDEFIQAFCSYAGDHFEKQPRLQIVDKTAYYQHCIPVHNLSLSRVALGSFLNVGTYLERVAETTEVHADFEHDKRQLTIDFFTPIWGVNLRFVLEYDTIGSVVVNIGHTFDLYLVVSQPVTVFHGMHGKPGGQCMPFARQHNFVRVLEWSAEGNKSVVADCDTLRLQFTDRGDLMQVVSRVKWQQENAPIFFAPINCHLAPNRYRYRDCYFTEDDPTIRQMLPCPRQLSQRALYSLQAIVRRGCASKDQLLLYNEMQREEQSAYDRFLELVIVSFRQNQSATEQALDQVVDALDDRSRRINIIAMFTWCFNQSRNNSNYNDQLRFDSMRADVPENMLLVPKVVVTPSRLIPMPPELMLSNRVLHRFARPKPVPDNFIRVVFKDDNGSSIGKARCWQGMSSRQVEREEAARKLIDERTNFVLKNGLMVGKRLYLFLAWSNSQLRESGLYMYSADPTDRGSAQNPGEIRGWMGLFKDRQGRDMPIPKQMARMGQCFTQGQRTISLRDTHTVDADITKANTLHSASPYIFSDGVGRISPKCAKRVFATLPDVDQKITPSAFQIRFQGMKGMLCVDPQLEYIPVKGMLREVVFRDSMNKFQCPNEHILEVVKWSTPVGVTLNRPMIMILDQVSERNGLGVHSRLREHILGTLLEFRGLAEALIEEQKAALALHDRINTRVNFLKLKRSGISLTTEPFFRSLLLALLKYDVHHQLQKQQVEIPASYGRTFYGVMDETLDPRAQLKYGQVFVQYSTSMSKPGDPDIQGETKILKGRVLVTKNPCVTAGDVRMLEAVDVPQLRHLVDVIVFPRQGPRPHPDEMAGSDLDGDEYAVIWDPQLDFGSNEEPMDYSCTPDGSRKIFLNNVYGMIDYFVHYLKGDNVGTVANSHLVTADLLGILHRNCLELAKLHSQAVDFPKTGVPVGRLSVALRPSKYPDYMEKNHMPTYQSPRLVGEIYRLYDALATVVSASSDQLFHEVTCDDQLLLADVDDAVKLVTRRDRDDYSHYVQELIDRYGVESEAALVSGRLITLRNRIREKETYELYSTDRLIKRRFNSIQRHFRHRFFTDFCDEKELWPRDEEGNFTQKFVTLAALRRKFGNCSKVLQKASACYESVYADSARGSVSFLSFAWLFWDILAIIKQLHSRETQNIDPIKLHLNTQIDGFMHGNTNYDMDPRRRQRIALWRAKIVGVPTLFEYCDLRPGLVDVCVLLCEWAHGEHVFDGSPIKSVHLCLLLVQFGTGQLTDTGRERREKPISTEIQEAGLFKSIRSELLLDFLGYLSSRQFQNLPQLDFRHFGVDSCFENDEWHFLSKAAFSGFYSLSMLGDLPAFGLTGDTSTASVKEIRSFMISLSATQSVKILEELWKRQTNCEAVCLRRHSKQPQRVSEVLVSARGSVQALQQLRHVAMNANGGT